MDERAATGTRNGVRLWLVIVAVMVAMTAIVGAATRLKIDRYIANAGGEFSLMEGGLLYDRPGKRRSAESILRSLFGLIAIRG